MIKILSQNKDRIKDCYEVFIGRDEDRYIINGNGKAYYEDRVELGVYSTKEKAQQVIIEIMQTLHSKNLNKIYIMPQDD